MPERLPPVAVLAGGLATRLRPLTEAVPKSLVPVDGEPFLAHQLRLFARQGLKDVVICCGHLGEQIEAFASDGARFGCRVRYSYDGDRLRGTGGALRHALPLLGPVFFVTYGDSYLEADPREAYAPFAISKSPALMCVFKNCDQWDVSNAEVLHDCVVRYDKSARSSSMRYIDYGLSLLRASVLADWPEMQAFDLADVFRGLAPAGLLAAHEVRQRFYEIGSMRGLRETEQMLMAIGGGR